MNTAAQAKKLSKTCMQAGIGACFIGLLLAVSSSYFFLKGDFDGIEKNAHGPNATYALLHLLHGTKVLVFAIFPAVSVYLLMVAYLLIKASKVCKTAIDKD